MFAIDGHSFILNVPEKIFANVVSLSYSVCGVKRWFSGEIGVFRRNVLLVENTITGPSFSAGVLRGRLPGSAPVSLR